ncbi:hypothetical protein GQ55_3G276700 [Panicum hallii var. hallii]|uniref:Uncharacterized protein n=1 Tax=Panicum hallii var. hallii TaxID=1504633 RepID=A0A2T7EE02_9POAL|nr:hypothetical protein GQ55_3G276700 [Panicum hallii var. hallii]
MLTFICRRRLLRLHRIPSAAGTNPSQPNPINALLSRGYSSAFPAGSPISEPCPATVSYLISRGLSPTAAAARKLRIRSTERADAVLALFRSYGFSDVHITKIVRQAPAILNLDPDRILRPKLDFFASLGVQPPRFATTPILLTRSLNKHLVPCIQFLRGIVGTDRDVCRAIFRNPRALGADLEKQMRPCVDTLRRLGLREESISKLLILGMSVLLISPDRMCEIFKDLKALGASVKTTGFLYGIRARSCLSRETWLRKVALYQSFGASEGELLKALKKQPTMLLYSEENITKKLRFYLDELKLELSDVMGHPVLMGCSVEKCIKPRCAVLDVLMREGKIEPSIKLASAFLGSTSKFSQKYVLRYAHDVPDVVKAYKGEIKFEGFRDHGGLVPVKP